MPRNKRNCFNSTDVQIYTEAQNWKVKTNENEISSQNDVDIVFGCCGYVKLEYAYTLYREIVARKF